MTAGSTRVVVVVGAALLDRGRLLAARRVGPPALAGGWELPGGKVELGESDRDALVRECLEELGSQVVLGAQVGGDWPLGSDALLRVWVARLAPGSPRPRAGSDHSVLRWLPAGRRFEVDWLPADLPVVRALELVEDALPWRA